MAEQAYPYINETMKTAYPLTKMNFRVIVNDVDGSAAFNQVTGIDAQVDVIEFRQGNSNSLSPVKIPGLVKHGNVTLRFGYTKSAEFKEWIAKCVNHERSEPYPRKTVTIEMIDIANKTPTEVTWTQGDGLCWVLNDAWVAHYTGPELDASNSDVAIESVEIAFETMTIPN